MPHVYIIIPVFNRLAFTKKIISCIKNQTYKNFTIVIVNDGSTDQTQEYLSNEKGVETIVTKGGFWWSKSMNAGIKYIRDNLNDDDFVLFLNNDTFLKPDYIENAINFSRKHNICAIGSVLYDFNQPEKLLDLATRTDQTRLHIFDIKNTIEDTTKLDEFYEADFLPGRGTLYPAYVIKKVGLLRAFLLPHYRSDYEYSNRVKNAGCNLLVSTNLITFSTETHGNQRIIQSRFYNYFGKSSPNNIFQYYSSNVHR